MSRSIVQYSGTVREVEQASEWLDGAWHDCHLVSPETACAFLAEGWELAFSRVPVDIDRETYLITGGNWNGEDAKSDRRTKRPTDRLGLNRFALDRIARAADVSWNPRESQRLDDGHEPHYCHYQAVGTYPTFTGDRATTLDHKEIDLREGSAYIETLRAQARNARPERDPEPQIRNERTHIMSFCVTKAMNRAIRRLGVHTWYTREELERKPFVVVRAVFTGRTSDPILRPMFAAQLASRGQSAYAALYGGSVVNMPNPNLVAPDAHAAPPVGEVEDDEIVEEPSKLYCEYCGRLDQVTVRTTPAGEIRYCRQQACVDEAIADAKQAEADERGLRERTRITVRADAAPQQMPQRGPSLRAQETAANSPNAGGVRAQPRRAGSKPASPGSATSRERPASSSPAAPPSPVSPRGASAPATSQDPHPGVAGGGALTIPYGAEKGVPLADASTGELAWAIGWMKRRFDEKRVPAKFIEKDERLLRAMLAEYDRRAMEGDVCGEGADEIPH